MMNQLSTVTGLAAKMKEQKLIEKARQLGKPVLLNGSELSHEKKAFVTPVVKAIGRGLVKSNPKVKRLAVKARRAYRSLPEQHRKDFASIGKEVGRSIDDKATSYVKDKLKGQKKPRK